MKFSRFFIIVKLFILLVLFSLNGIAQEKASFQLTYKVEVKDLPKEANALNMVVPVPESDKYQTIDNLTIETKHPYTLHTESQFDNKYLRVNLNSAQIPEKLDLVMKFDVTRSAVNSENGYKAGSEALQRYVRPDSLIPLSPEIKKETRKALQGEQDREKQAKAFYDYLISTMTYDKSGEGWGRGDAIYACNVKEGNCTDFHSLFLGMCRTKEIPARFHIGFPIPKEKEKGKLHGYHCWAEFFLADEGWVPVDISEAWKDKEMRDFYFGNLDPYRVNFTSGRDIPIEIKPGKIKKFNYFIYPEVYVDGKNYNEVKTHFSFQYNQ